MWWASASAGPHPRTPGGQRRSGSEPCQGLYAERFSIIQRFISLSEDGNKLDGSSRRPAAPSPAPHEHRLKSGAENGYLLFVKDCCGWETVIMQQIGYEKERIRAIEDRPAMAAARGEVTYHVEQDAIFLRGAG